MTDPQTTEPVQPGDPDLRPEDPNAAGIGAPEPDASHVEGARILTAQALPRLRPQGFDEAQVRRWAEAFVTHDNSGDIDAFLAWVDRQQL